MEKRSCATARQERYSYTLSPGPYGLSAGLCRALTGRQRDFAGPLRVVSGTLPGPYGLSGDDFVRPLRGRQRVFAGSLGVVSGTLPGPYGSSVGLCRALTGCQGGTLPGPYGLSGGDFAWPLRVVSWDFASVFLTCSIKKKKKKKKKKGGGGGGGGRRGLNTSLKPIFFLLCYSLLSMSSCRVSGTSTGLGVQPTL